MNTKLYIYGGGQILKVEPLFCWCLNVNSTFIKKKCLWGRTSILGKSANTVLRHAAWTHKNTLSCFYLFLGKSSCHICGRTQSWRGQSSKRPPGHHHRGECRCQCRELWGGIWKAHRIKKEPHTIKKNKSVCLTLAAPVCWWLCHLRNKNQMPTNTNPVYNSSVASFVSSFWPLGVSPQTS